MPYRENSNTRPVCYVVEISPSRKGVEESQQNHPGLGRGKKEKYTALYHERQLQRHSTPALYSSFYGILSLVVFMRSGTVEEPGNWAKSPRLRCGGVSMPSPSWMVCCACHIPLLSPAAYPLGKSVNRLVQSSSEDKLPKGFHKGKTKTEALEPIEKERKRCELTG